MVSHVVVMIKARVGAEECIMSTSVPMGIVEQAGVCVYACVSVSMFIRVLVM